MGMMIEVLKNMLLKPFTIAYPKKKSKVAVKYRGELIVDQEKCISCGMCERNCPTGAITLNKKTRKAESDAALCIFCSLCAEVCPVKCIHFTNKYENAVTDREMLKPKKQKRRKRTKKLK